MTVESSMSTVNSKKNDTEHHCNRQLSEIVRVLRSTMHRNREQGESKKIAPPYNAKENLKEYTCTDCRTILQHYNPATLDSLKNIHEKLCPVKRRRGLDLEHIRLAKI